MVWHAVAGRAEPRRGTFIPFGVRAAATRRVCVPNSGKVSTKVKHFHVKVSTKVKHFDGKVPTDVQHFDAKVSQKGKHVDDKVSTKVKGPMYHHIWSIYAHIAESSE